MTTETEDQQGSAEQKADLAALTVAASQEPAAPGQPGTPAAPPAEQQATAVDLEKDIGGMISLVVTIGGPAFPSLARIYTEEATAAAASVSAALCKKHGWLENGVGGKYAEEIAAAAVLGPLAMATVKGIQADIAERDQDKPAERSGEPQLSAPASTEAVGAKTVSFGAPVA